MRIALSPLLKVPPISKRRKLEQSIFLIFRLPIMNPNIDKLVRRTTMVATVTVAYFLLTADYGPEPNVLDPNCVFSLSPLLLQVPPVSKRRKLVIFTLSIMNPNTDKLVRRTTMVATVTAAYFLLTADYGPEPNVLDPIKNTIQSAEQSVKKFIFGSKQEAKKPAADKHP
ncbi:hypothetical protein L6452_20343 [Arctium lappa]|uniref:Uncharacterized protein n=1 Tax=Arctium lappa TaxID=4217 RepID=A0ACB9BA99_ARCLA|nr:hypothetical protein L6452_20343 [Arctium lappa]